MDYRWHEISQLAALLEAEIAGHAVDRAKAHHLATTLAEHHPEIGNSLRMIRERMRSPSA